MNSKTLDEYMKLLAKHEGTRGAEAIEGGGYTRGYGLTDLAQSFIQTRGANADEMSDEELAREYVIWNAEQLKNKFDNYDSWPDSVKIAAVDLAYNGGDVLKFKNFSTALSEGRYQDALGETLDIVGANDPKTGKRGALRGLGNRRFDIYNLVANELEFPKIQGLDVIESNSGSIFSYSLEDGNNIEKSVSVPIHSASGSYDQKKKTLEPLPKEFPLPEEGSFEAIFGEKKFRPMKQLNFTDDGHYLTSFNSLNTEIESMSEVPVGAGYSKNIKDLIAKDIEENGFVTQTIKDNGMGVASPFLFMDTDEQYKAAFRTLNPIKAMQEAISNMMIDIDDDPDYDFMQDPQLKNYQDSLLYFMDSRSSVDTGERIKKLEQEIKDADALSASSSGEAQLFASLASFSTFMPVASTGYLGANLATRATAGALTTGGAVGIEQGILSSQRVLHTDTDALKMSGVAAIFGGGVSSVFGKQLYNARMNQGIFAPYKSYSKELTVVGDKPKDLQIYKSAGSSVNSERARQAAYANIEQEALKETGINLEKVGWNPVIRLLKSPNPIVRGVVAELVDLGGMMQKKVDDEVAMASSVESNFTAKYVGELLGAIRLADQQYLAYRGVVAKDSDISRSFQIFGLQAKDKFSAFQGRGSSHLTEADFRIRVAKAMRRGDVDSVSDMATPHVETVAQRARQHFEFIKGEATSVRLFETQIRKAITAARASDDTRRVAELEAKLASIQENGVFLNNAQSYLPRIYRIDKILAEEARFRAILRRHAIEELNLQGREIQKFVDDTFDSVTHQKPFYQIDELDEFEDVSIASGVRGRELDIDDVKIEDFLENDIEVLLRHHTKQMGMDIELTRQFGSVDMKNVIDQVTDEYTRLINASRDPIKREQLRKDLRQNLTDIRGLRDRVRGTYGASKDPHAMSSRFVRAMKSFNVIVGMGSATVSSIPDVFRIAMVEGLSNSYGYGISKMFTESGRRLMKMNQAELRAAGVAADAVLGLRAQAFADIGDMFGNRFAAERYLSASTGVMFLLNGLNMWNQVMKEFAGNVTMIRMVEDMMMTPWASMSKSQKEKFLKVGIDQQMVTRMSRMIEEHGNVVDGVYVPNTSMWTDRVAAQRFRAALTSTVDRIIITPGAGDRALWTSTELGSLLTQFKSFGQAATVRMLTSGLQEKDGAFWQGAILLIGMAGIVNEIKRIQYGIDKEESFDEKLINAIDRSGILGWGMDVNNAIEKLSNRGIGVRPMFTDEKRGYIPFAAKMGAVGGPTAGNIANLGSIIGDVLGGRADQNTLNSLRFLTPYSNLPYADPLFDRMYGQ